MKTDNPEEEHHLRARRCLRCAASFEYKRCSKKYCSDSCKQFAYLERKKVNEAPLAPQKKIGFIKRIINWFCKK
jgi:hypothetical protein